MKTDSLLWFLCIRVGPLFGHEDVELLLGHKVSLLAEKNLVHESDRRLELIFCRRVNEDSELALAASRNG